jgi:hypothetical protein
MQILFLQDDRLVFGFGKFEGKTVEEVADIEPSYLTWVRNSDLIAECSDSLFEMLDSTMQGRGIPLFRRR